MKCSADKFEIVNGTNGDFWYTDDIGKAEISKDSVIITTYSQVQMPYVSRFRYYYTLNSKMLGYHCLCVVFMIR